MIGGYQIVDLSKIKEDDEHLSNSIKFLGYNLYDLILESKKPILFQNYQHLIGYTNSNGFSYILDKNDENGKNYFVILFNVGIIGPEIDSYAGLKIFEDGRIKTYEL